MDGPLILQLGTGVFLRGFWDWMVQTANDRVGWGASVTVAKLTPTGGLDAFEAQDGEFTHVLRGLQDGEPSTEELKVRCIDAWIDPYGEWERFLALARDPRLRFVVSNATEAGLVYTECPPPTACPASFPAKVTALLHARFSALEGAADAGLVLLPLELVEGNGAVLRECVLRHARDWELGDAFVSWLESDNRFISTLVDRIVTGSTEEERQAHETAGADRLLDISEPYHFLALEAEEGIEAELPLHRSGLNVVWASDLAPYHLRKVRILNGSHACLVFLGSLLGHETVLDAMEDPALARFLRHCVHEEIVPTLEQPEAELRTYVEETFERFRNPWLRHRLRDIALNSLAKVKVRLLAPILDAHRERGTPPPGLCLAFAAFLVAYRDPDFVRDTDQVRERFADRWEAGTAHEAVAALLGDRALWDRDLTEIPGFAPAVRAWVARLLEFGPEATLATFSDAPPSV